MAVKQQNLLISRTGGKIRDESISQEPLAKANRPTTSDFGVRRVEPKIGELLR